MLRRSGVVPGRDRRAQSIELYRKVALRRQLLAAAGPGPAYVPFIGDADLAVELYADRPIYGADLDPKRIATAAARLPTAILRVANCDHWPFATETTPAFALADFDDYIYPYPAFRAFWSQAPKAGPIVVVFTDAQRIAAMIAGRWRDPAGVQHVLLRTDERRAVYHGYLARHIYPWIAEYVKPWRVRRRIGYLRRVMTYWGAVIEEP